MKCAPRKDFKVLEADLRRIYQPANEEEAFLALHQFTDRRNNNYPSISRNTIKNHTLSTTDDSSYEVAYLTDPELEGSDEPIYNRI
jgi:transposase-like protein